MSSFQILDLNVGQIVKFRVFVDSPGVMLVSVDAFAVVDYFPAKISFLPKFYLEDGQSKGTKYWL